MEQYYDRGIIHGLPCRRNIAEIIRLRDTEFSQIQSQLRFRIQPRFLFRDGHTVPLAVAVAVAVAVEVAVEVAVTIAGTHTWNVGDDI